MSLEKITLKLGKKKIKLTVEEFEELKQDMRDLDRDYRWYWFSAPPYRPYWYTNTSIAPLLAGNSTPVGSTADAISNTTITPSDDMTKVDFAGNVLSYNS